MLLDFIEDHFLVNLTAKRYWLSLKLVSETLLAFDFFIQQQFIYATFWI